MKVVAPGNLQGKELLDYLVENKRELIELKKSAIKFADSFALHVLPETSVLKTVAVTKAEKNADSVDVTIVGNTYGWLDSHEDVHIDGIFTKSIAESQTKILHLHDHVQQLTAKVGKPQSIYEQAIKWTELGINKSGGTTALLMDSKVMKAYNEMIFEGYQNKEIDQHSVGMVYVQLFMCVNDKGYKEEFANWNKYIGYVGNADKAEKLGYFFAVTEAKLKEISCVIAGSNELTPTLEVKGTEVQPVVTTVEQPPIGKIGSLSKFFN